MPKPKKKQKQQSKVRVIGSGPGLAIVPATLPKRTPNGSWQIVPDAAQIEAAVLKSQELDMPCVICSKPTFNRSVYAPVDPVAAGMGKPKAGKLRVDIYAVCDHCLTIPNYMGMVEFSIKAAGAAPDEAVWDGAEMLAEQITVVKNERNAKK